MNHLNKTPIVDQLGEQIHQLDLFRGVGIEAIEGCLNQCTIESFPANHELINPVDPKRILYIVLEGQLEVRLPSTGKTPTFIIKKGSCAGEMSMIEDTHPSATVVVTEPSQLLCISENIMWCLINCTHRFAVNFLVTLSSRLRFDNEYIVKSDKILAQYMRNSITDSLTDLNNRRWMQRMFTRKIARAKQQNDYNLCVAILDLDHFKLFNDSFGHQAGDQILQQISSSLRDLFRPTDLIVRFGGDEFAVLLPDTDKYAAQKVCERVLKGTCHKLSQISANFKHVTMSIGVGQLRADDNLKRLLERADRALYFAKNHGRNRVSTEPKNGTL